MNDQNITVALRLPIDLVGEVDRAAKSELITRSALIRRLIARALRPSAPRNRSIVRPIEIDGGYG